MQIKIPAATRRCRDWFYIASGVRFNCNKWGYKSINAYFLVRTAIAETCFLCLFDRYAVFGNHYRVAFA